MRLWEDGVVYVDKDIAGADDSLYNAQQNVVKAIHVNVRLREYIRWTTWRHLGVDPEIGIRAHVQRHGGVSASLRLPAACAP